MTPEEHLTLSPWEKCTRFRRFPVKFVVQMALVATCSLQTLYYTDSVIPYFLDADRMLHAAFYGFDSQDGGRVDAVWSPPGNSGRWSAEIMHKEDFSRSIQQLGQTFLDFPKDAIDRYDIRGSQAVIKAQIEWRSDAEYLQTLEMTDERGHLDTDLQFQSADCRGLTWDDSVATSPGALCAAFDIDPLNATEGGIGPFGSFTEWHRFFPRLVRLQLQVALTDYDASFLTKLGKSHCTVEWIVTAMYTVRSSGLVQVGYDTSARLASRDNQHNMPSGSGDARTVFTDGAKRIYPEGVGTTTQYLTWYWLCTATMTLSSLSFVLCTRALLSNWLNSRALAKYPESLPYLRAQEKKRTSRSWLLLTLLQNIVNIASTLQLSSESFSQDFTETDWLLSSSIFLTLLNATRYLEWFPKYYILVSALAQGLPSVLRFIVGCLPVYMAYALFGTLMFGKISVHFASIRRSMITLFSLLNGDSMLQIFDSIYVSGWAGFVSEVYLISFVCLFIYSALNIFIQIMQSAFDHTQVKWHQNAQKIAGLEAWAKGPAVNAGAGNSKEDGATVAVKAKSASHATRCHSITPAATAGDRSGTASVLPVQSQQNQQQQQQGWPPVHSGDRFGSWQRGQRERMRAHAPTVGFVSWGESSNDGSASARHSRPNGNSFLLPAEDTQNDSIGLAVETGTETLQISRFEQDAGDHVCDDGTPPPPPMPAMSICESPLAALSPCRQHSGDPGHQSCSSAARVGSIRQRHMSLVAAREGLTSALAAMDREIESLRLAVAAAESAGPSSRSGNADAHTGVQGDCRGA